MNYEIFSVINGLAGQSSVLDALGVFAAKYLIYLFFAGAAAVTLLRAREDGWWPAGAWRIGQVGATLAIGFAFSVAVRMLGLSLRPFQTHQVHQLIEHAPGTSLPSDHATASFAVAIAVWFFVSRKWGPYFMAVAAVIAVSRVFVGVHYPADITAGALLATIAGLLVWGATLALRERVLPPARQQWDEDQLTEDRALESTK
ncbi:undecaprenyl-diphosphate phosphatase BcrC [Kutzneria viridogrisea]|uniref:Undecaprenyl-diphosphatase n=2 Tax=Kutzneria TaxID=43356 RepID=A0ABR6BYX3_9PSEU|nr:phosphatase PAP2 family protein [Kutzneria albida]AHH97139.1 putative membrane protein [Kutzneria albida DSM 43870]MBA8931890.1 undecaprenyl-diphosphatase [Kutzneria viridogrisea]